MQLQQRLQWILASLLAASCARVPPPVAAPSPARESASPPAGPPGAIAWTWQRAADPELVHLHVRAASAPGAFLVPWLEGVTLRPCAIVVVDHAVEVQRTRLRYDETGRLLEVAADGSHDALERAADGRLLRGHGLQYVWVEGTLAKVVESAAAPAREHALRYDEAGRLVGIESTVVEADAEPRQLRDQTLVYDGELLTERRWRDDDGAHGATYFVYDERGRLVRVDVESTTARGDRVVQPTQRMEYRDDRLVEFGRATVRYDDGGRAVAVESADGLRTEYRYVCG